MALKFTTSYIEDSIALFRYYKLLADRAMAQVTDEELFLTLDCEANSIAIVVKHMAGNMRSRWTDFLSTDGEKPDRNATLSSPTPHPRARRCSSNGKTAGQFSLPRSSRLLTQTWGAPSTFAAKRTR
jgi:hypothetical protein